MAKTKISEFSTTPGDNTDINGINIAEGCAPSGINNAIRELMSDLKEWQSGAMDVYVVPQGTAAAPGIQFYSDTNTGLYRYAADQLGIAVGGVSAGYFSSDGWVGNVVATTIDLTNIEVTNIKAKDGTAAISIADSTGKVTVSSELAVDNLNLSGNTFSSTDTNGNIVLAPNGTGDVYLDADTIRVGDANSNVTVTTNGTGDLILNTNSGTNSGAITIEDGVNGNILIATNGTGQVQLTGDLDVTTVEVTNIKAKDGTSVFTLTDSTGAVSIANAVTMAATTQNIALGTSQTSGTFTVGGAAQTGTQTFDQSTKTHTLNIGTGATESAATKTINIGTGGVATSTTAIAVGSTNGTTITLNGTVNATTVNATTLDLTNLEVANIKAKDGTASITLADSTGVATLSANPILNAGTANGVVYLNASKSATSGSALTFDGTNLFTSGSFGLGISPSTKLDISGGSGGIVYVRATGDAYQEIAGGSRVPGTGSVLVGQGNAGEGYLWNRFNSYLSFGTNAAEKMRLDSSGNLGLGVTPSAWSGYGVPVIEAPAGGTFVSAGNGNIIGSNWYYTGSNFVYKTTNAASYTYQVNGQHRWFTAPSGTADGTAATSLTSAQNGNSYTIKVAGTTDFTLIGAANNNVGTTFTKSGGTGAGTGTVSQNISFTQAMTLDASGNLGIGATSPKKRLTVNDASSSSTTPGSNPVVWIGGGNVTLNTLSEIGFTYGANSWAESNAPATVGFQLTSTSGYGKGALTFCTRDVTTDTAPTERARITSGGYFKASDDGAYAGLSDAYHEFDQSSASAVGVAIYTDSASYTGNSLYLYAARNTTNNSFYALSYYNGGASAFKFRVADSGDVTNTNGTYGTISDAKMKTDIVDAGSQWSDIKALRFRKFKMKNDPSGLVQLGVVAQEVEQTSPGLVDEHADKDAEGNDLGTTTKSVKTSVLLMKAAVALQEAMARIEKLEAEVAALKGA